MTLFDYIALTIVVLSLGFGLWRGMISEILALVAWGLGVYAAFLFGPKASGLFAGMVGEPVLRVLLGGLLVFLGILILMALIRLLVLKMVRVLKLTTSDRLLGMLFGLARGALIVLLLVGLGGLTQAPSQPWWRDAVLAPPLETAVLAIKPLLPADLAKRIRFS
ncbi:CvpA family protein [Azonexus sp.]|uniref:CvpA family protein n=1 Tax=Azonexus sp. TaxID=1872668 RepID=UPI0039E29DCD